MRYALHWLALVLLAAAAALLPAKAQAYDAAQLESLLAPVALQPDAVLWQVLDAATAPDEVLEAADWSRANPGIEGNDAVRAVQDRDWLPSVKALVAYPDLLARMAESPQWLEDLGEAYATQQADVLASVQALRQRAHASGHLQSDSYQSVRIESQAIAVQPVVSHIYAVRHYDPFVVYGPLHWHHRPVFWRPWAVRPVFVHHPHFVVRHHPRVIVRHHHRPKAHSRHQPPAVVVHRGAVPQPGHRIEHRRDRDDDERSRRGYWRNGPPSAAALQQRQQTRDYLERQRGGPGAQPYRPIPEAQRRPIVRSDDGGGRISALPSVRAGAPSLGAERRGTYSGMRPMPR